MEPNGYPTSEETVEAPELIDERISLQTMLVDAAGSKNPEYTEVLNLVDHIKYEGLTPGEEYEITGELYEQSSSKKVRRSPSLAELSTSKLLPHQEKLQFLFCKDRFT